MDSSTSSHASPSLPSYWETRQARLPALLAAANLDALALNAGPTLTYLLGMEFHLSERPVIALFAPDQHPTLILPQLEAAKPASAPFPINVFTYGEDPDSWKLVFSQAFAAVGLEQAHLGIEPLRLRYLELAILQDAAPAARILPAETLLNGLRMYKDSSEIAAMQRAVVIAQEALAATLPQIRIGMSERDLAAELTLQLLRHGSDSQFPFAPIVSGGPNSANPHASPSARPLAAGDLLVIDWGANFEGYASDLTRTFAVGEPEPELARIAAITLEANAAGRAAARPGVSAHAVDHAARFVIEAAGYGPYFIHRTGHGLGLEAHEPPYIRPENGMLLAEGMTFTVEPGIYLPERNGVRIEDNVVITADGAITLSDFPRELQVVG
jgi:Xaa-Pro dipeptidase